MDTPWEYIGVQKSGLKSYQVYKAGTNEYITKQEMYSMCTRYANFKELYISGEFLVYRKLVKKNGPIVQETITYTIMLTVIENQLLLKTHKSAEAYAHKERAWRSYLVRMPQLITDNRDINVCIRETTVMSTELSAKSMSILYAYQVDIVKLVTVSMQNNVVTLNGSDTGTGKTIMTMCCVLELKKTAVCVSPKSVITPWKKAAELVGVSLYVNNYEQFKNGNTVYLKRISRLPSKTDPLTPQSIYQWTLPPGTVVIFDEAHKIKNCNTENFAMLHALLKVPDIRVVLLSATISDREENVMSLLYSLGIVKSVPDFKTLMTDYAIPTEFGYTYIPPKPPASKRAKNNDAWKIREPEVKLLADTRKNNPLMAYLNTMIYPKYGARLQIKNCTNFPMNVIEPILCDIPEVSEIRGLYQEIQDFLAHKRAIAVQARDTRIASLMSKVTLGTATQDEQQTLHKLQQLQQSATNAGTPAALPDSITPLQGKANEIDTTQCILTLRLRARQRVEMYKVPIIIEMTLKMISENYNVIIFVCFNDTLCKIRDILISKGEVRISTVHGKQTGEERDIEILKFQDDVSRVIIVNIYAGGVGVSLHDTHNNYPRRSILTVTDDATALKQSLGRSPRVGALSGCIQYILFCAGTVEEDVHRNVVAKIHNIDTLNDTDLTF